MKNIRAYVIKSWVKNLNLKPFKVELNELHPKKYFCYS